MARSKGKTGPENTCPQCEQPPETSGNGPDGGVVYTCAAGHQWASEQAKG